DAHSSDRRLHQEQVQRVLAELGVAATPQLLVWNKADLLAPGTTAPAAALPGEPLEEVRLHLPEQAGALLHEVHEHGHVLSQLHTAHGVDLVARVPQSLLARVSPYRAGRKRSRPVENT